MSATVLNSVNGKASLSEAKRHNKLRGTEFWLKREELLAGGLRSYVPQDNHLLAICSEVKNCRGEVGHIPLLDFHIPSDKKNTKLVAEVTRLVFGKGIVLESGKSFHAYGKSVVTHDTFMHQLKIALLYAPIVDRAFVAHQLIESRAVLRVSTSVSKPSIPIVVFDCN